MENAIAELLNKFGYGSVWTLFIVMIVKFIIKPVFDILLEVYKERENSKLQSRMEKEKNVLQSQLEMENKIKSSSLEFDKYKKDFVLPILQKIANILEKNSQIIQDYNTFLIQDFLKKANNKQLEIINSKSEQLLTELKKEVGEISIYLPKEIRSILLTFHVSIENELLNIKNLAKVSNRELSQVDILSLTGNNAKIYQNHLNCFYELIQKYIEINYEKKDYLSIFEKYNLDDEGEYVSRTNAEDYCTLYILAVKKKNLKTQQEILKTIINQ